jgi:Domain of unknown function (DUF1877)
VSITTCYGRLSNEEYAAMRASSDGLVQFADGTLPDEQCLYLDKAAPVIAWLLSPYEREQQAQFARVVRDRENAPVITAPLTSPVDDVLAAVMGVGEKDAKLDMGLGPATVHRADTVVRYAQLLAKIDEPQLREHLDFEEMEAAALSIDGWLDEGEELFTECVLPLFRQLKLFYKTAAEHKQIVLVWHE